MKELFQFFIKHSAWLVFAVYFVLSTTFLVNRNLYQQSVYLTSANAVSASVYSLISSVTSYFNLRSINEDLLERNAVLEMEVITLYDQVEEMKTQLADTTQLSNGSIHFDYVVGRVISNSVYQPYNYITINRGRADGVKPEMGVVDRNGVVGIVNVVGEYNSRVISLLNPNMRLSCKLKKSDFFGSLAWDGKSPYEAVLEELPRHAKFAKGDTIVTSGYSSVFPAGLVVGVIKDTDSQADDNLNSIRVTLSTDFTQLRSVRIIRNSMKPELDKLKKEDKTDESDSK